MLPPRIDHELDQKRITALKARAVFGPILRLMEGVTREGDSCWLAGFTKGGSDGIRTRAPGLAGCMTFGS